MTRRLQNPDVRAILILIGLWLLFFWRLLTPITSDQASLALGDFSGQFVAFAGYQYSRFAEGAVPLWNPYNNGGLPFLADTQAAVFYPPRLVTIFLSRLAGGWSYNALQLEMVAHVLFFSLTLYAFARRLIGSVFGAFITAVVGTYGGFLTGYPPLQLAILEAAAWLPLALLALHNATEPQPPSASREQRVRNVGAVFSVFSVAQPFWLLLTGVALGLSWMAGHPQTSYFITLLLVAYTAYRMYERRETWQSWLGIVLVFGALAFGLAAVQLIPGIEYLIYTARANMTFDDKANGFPLQDVLQFLLPGVVSVFSPLYIGIIGLVLAAFAIWRRIPGTLFWVGATVVALLWSFGANSPVYPLLYNLLPGLRFFRGQERAALIVALSLSMLAGFGAAYFVRLNTLTDYPIVLQLRLWLNRLFLACAALFALALMAWLANGEQFGGAIGGFALSTIVAGLALFLVPWLVGSSDKRQPMLALTALLVFELFSANMGADAVYDPVPASQQLSLTPPPLVEPVAQDTTLVARVDGFRGLTDNYGSLYRIYDMRGISPLFLSGPYNIMEPDKINPRAWEVFAVRYVYSDWAELPVPSEVIASGTDRWGAVNLHRLSDPRPFGHLVYSAETVRDDVAAHARLRDPAFDPRRVALLNVPPEVELPAEPPADAGEVVLTNFAPERFRMEVTAPANAILTVAHPHYPGWYAALNGFQTPIYRAYGGLSAIAIPAGTHDIDFVYDPLIIWIGAGISIVTWLGLLLLPVLWSLRRNDSFPQEYMEEANDRAE